MQKYWVFVLCFLSLSGIWLQSTSVVSAQNSAPCSGSPQFLASISLDNPTAYQQDMLNFVASVETFWRVNMANISSIGFASPCVIEYDPQSVPFTEECGLTTEIATGNAFYCVPVHVVMWDGPTLFHPLYTQLGDKANLFVIAHEYGHAAQFLSGEVPLRSVNRELQADCYAGAYIQYAEQSGMLSEGDYQEIVAVVAAFGQSRIGSNWLTRSHGTSIQREIAMGLGYQQGVTGCQVDFESLAEDGIERPLATSPSGETTVTLPNGEAVTIVVPEDGDSIEITAPNGETHTVPVPPVDEVCPPRLPRCR